MPHHNNLSESEEMYLVTIRKICESCTDTPIPIPHLAQELDVLPVSVNQMVKKLAGRGLVDYLPYKGVELTAPGREIADRVLRGRRLWALFLVERLDLSAVRADAIACDLEHITPPDLADRLAHLLGDPTTGPQGRPIPNPRHPASGRTMALSDLPVGTAGSVAHLTGSPAAQSFLAGEGLAPGVEINLLARGRDGHCLLQIGSTEIHLGGRQAESVVVRVP